MHIGVTPKGRAIAAPEGCRKRACGVAVVIPGTFRIEGYADPSAQGRPLRVGGLQLYPVPMCRRGGPHGQLVRTSDAVPCPSRTMI